MGYEEYLNEVICPDYESEEWIIGGEWRNESHWQRYGTALKLFDPIAFEVGKNEYERENS